MASSDPQNYKDENKLLNYNQHIFRILQVAIILIQCFFAMYET